MSLQKRKSFGKGVKILILGHMRHGKSTLAQIIFEEFGYKYDDSSMAAGKIFIYDQLKEKYSYSSFQECYEDRKQHRSEWYDLICEYNTPDNAKLAKDILKTNDMYVGMRANDELQACLKENLFDVDGKQTSTLLDYPFHVLSILRTKGEYYYRWR